VRLHLVTPAEYESPAAAVAARLLARVAEDVLLPEAYLAHCAGSHLTFEALQTGLKVSASGFPDVLAQLLPRALSALVGG
jgi:secreted Zn-dependent insulinase-like peptidase